MGANQRLLWNAVIRLVFVGFAGWMALGGETALPGAHMVTRVAFVALFLGVAILLGEVAQMREHMGMLLKVLRSGVGAGPVAGVRDDREAVDVLIKGLASVEAQVRERAHHHLKRLTGQALPADPAAWQLWWSTHRDQLPARPARTGGEAD